MKKILPRKYVSEDNKNKQKRKNVCRKLLDYMKVTQILSLLFFILLNFAKINSGEGIKKKNSTPKILVWHECKERYVKKCVQKIAKNNKSHARNTLFPFPCWRPTISTPVVEYLTRRTNVTTAALNRDYRRLPIVCISPIYFYLD